MTVPTFKVATGSDVVGLIGDVLFAEAGALLTGT